MANGAQRLEPEDQSMQAGAWRLGPGGWVLEVGPRGWGIKVGSCRLGPRGWGLEAEAWLPFRQTKILGCSSRKIF